MRRIDSHVHFWTLAMEPHYGLWMTPELSILYRDYSPRDAEPLMAANSVDGCVLVSAASSIHEMGYLLGLADGHEFIRGVVGWIDLLAPDAPEQIALWARAPKLKSVRPYLQDLPDDWILRLDLGPAIRAIEGAGLRFDALIKPRQIRNTIAFIERNPNLPVIVDHMSKPEINKDGLAPWRRDMQAFRDLKHVHCKLSGILTEDGNGWTYDRVAPYIEAVLEIFGPERLVFGSDWPVVNLVSDYGRWIDVVERVLSRLTSREQQLIWGLNAERFYGL